MLPTKLDRPYFEAWLRRSRKQFAISGRLSQVALVLSMENGETAGTWRTRLRSLLDDKEPPSLDLLMRIDLILAKPAEKRTNEVFQDTFF